MLRDESRLQFKPSKTKKYVAFGEVCTLVNKTKKIYDGLKKPPPPADVTWFNLSFISMRVRSEFQSSNHIV